MKFEQCAWTKLDFIIQGYAEPTQATRIRGPVEMESPGERRPSTEAHMQDKEFLG